MKNTTLAFFSKKKEKKTKSLNTNKASQSSDIPAKSLEQNVDFFFLFVLDYLNKSINSSTFPSILKLADIIPVYKTDCQYEKSNYRPISVLPNLPKIFEKVLYDQISSFLGNILFKYQTGLRKGFSPQSCLVAMIEKFKTSLCQGGEYAGLLTDMSEAFDCLPHNQIIAKSPCLRIWQSIIKTYAQLFDRTHSESQNQWFLKPLESHQTWSTSRFNSGSHII